MPTRVQLVSLCALAALAGSGACDDGSDDPGADAASTGAGTGLSAGGGDGGGGGMGGDGAGGLGGDGSEGSVRIAITANPVDPSVPGADVEARLTVLASGVQAAVVSRRWSNVDDGTLADEVSAYPVPVLLVLNVVERAADGRPAALAGLAWGDASLRTELEAAVDAALAVAGDAPLGLVLGSGVDVYLGEHTSDVDALSLLLAHGVDHAIANAPAGTWVAVGLTSRVVDAPSPATDALAAMGNATAISYAPGLEQGGAVPSAIAVTSMLDAMLGRFSGRPLLLTGVGLASGAGASSSDEAQRTFFESFFGALGPRRARFPLVNVERLHDFGAIPCEAWALDQGLPGASAEADYACSEGLFDVEGEPKPAWDEVLAATAQFNRP